MSRGHILVVDDQPALADLAVVDLQESGYTALAAYSAGEGLAPPLSLTEPHTNRLTQGLIDLTG